MYKKKVYKNRTEYNILTWETYKKKQEKGDYIN